MGSPHWSCGAETRDSFLAKLWLEQNLFVTDALSLFFFGNDNKCLKDIGLGNILKNIL